MSASGLHKVDGSVSPKSSAAAASLSAQRTLKIVIDKDIRRLQVAANISWNDFHAAITKVTTAIPTEHRVLYVQSGGTLSTPISAAADPSASVASISSVSSGGGGSISLPPNASASLTAILNGTAPLRSGQELTTILQSIPSSTVLKILVSDGRKSGGASALNSIPSPPLQSVTINASPRTPASAAVQPLRSPAAPASEPFVWSSQVSAAETAILTQLSVRFTHALRSLLYSLSEIMLFRCANV